MMKRWLILCCMGLLAIPSALGQVARGGGGGGRVATGNRSANANRGNNANVNRSGNANVNRNYNNNTNVNRNVNVNNNVNVNRNYYGGACCGYRGAVVVEDNDWNWGAFAVGAAAGAVTTAAVASAANSSSTTVVATPAVGTVVTTLPGSCSTIQSGGGVIYNCNNIRYQPYYQGTTLVYQVVQ